MKIPESFFAIYQPKYTVPCVFDLNDRGTFLNRPSTTAPWGFRVVADTDFNVRIQFARLIHRPGIDSQYNKPYSWMVEEVLIDLDDELTPDQESVAGAIPDSEIRSALLDAFSEWRENFIPVKEGIMDREELNRKLTNAIEECKERIRKELVRKNQQWVYSRVPRRIQDFRYGLYKRVKDRLYLEYSNDGGEDSEKNLVKKIVLFNCVLENCDREDLLKPDGNTWKNENEILQCWIGFAGSEGEAKRVCRAMDTVFRDLQF